jgi:Na+/glutamate symporter
MATILLGLVALFFLGMGILGLVAPAALIKPFGIELHNPEARMEVRAVYGGFGVAIAVLLAFAAADVGGLRKGAALAVAAALLGMAFGRVVGRAADRPSGFYPIWFYFFVEVTGAALLIIAACCSNVSGSEVMR